MSTVTRSDSHSLEDCASMESTVSAEAYADLRLHVNGTVQALHAWKRELAALAAAEHVTQQAIAQSLATLEKRGLVTKSPDPGDGRKSLVTATESGHALLASIKASRDAWLSRAIEAAVTPDERAALETTIEILRRIADVDLRPDTEMQ
jgi:DNA-binding MarR family transcriptional regulator